MDPWRPGGAYCTLPLMPDSREPLPGSGRDSARVPAAREPRALPEDEYGLSPMQEGMLYHSLASARPGVDINQLVLTTDDDLDPTALMVSFEHVVERYPIFRTAFGWQEGTAPRQIVYPSVQVPVSHVDLRSVPADLRAEKKQEFLEADRRKGFDLAQAPLMRFTFLRLSDTHYELVWTFHHLYLDGRSIFICLNEWFDRYEAVIAGQPFSCEKPPLFGDYIRWLEAQRGDHLRHGEAFWKAQLRGVETATPLPELQEAPSELGGQLETRLSVELSDRVRASATRFGVTPNTIVQAAWAILLSRYSGETDVIFGATRACRHIPVPRALDIVGMMINTLPVRITVDENERLETLLARVRDQWVAMRPHEHIPLTKIQEWSDIKPGTPLFHSVLVFENFDWKADLRKKAGGWARREFEIVERTNLPITLACDLGEQIFLLIEYDRRVVGNRFAARLLGHMQHLLDEMTARPGVRVGELSIATTAELDQVLYQWNAQTVQPSDDATQTVVERIERAAKTNPDAVAIRDEQRELSYFDLWKDSEALALTLRARGVGPGTIVGVLARRSSLWPVAMLAIFRAGASYLPLDPEYPQDRLSFMLNDSRTPLVLLESSDVERLPREHGVTTIFLDDRQAWSRTEGSLASVKPDTAAYLLYTSGSTGRPNGVLVHHRALLNHVVAVGREYALTSADRVAQFASASFDVALEEIVPTLVAGATLVMRPRGLMDANAFLAWVQTHKLSVLNLPTAYWHELTQGMKREQVAVPETVRLVIVGGEAVSPVAYAAWNTLEGASRVRWLNGYGPTEVTITSTLFEPKTFAGDVSGFSQMPIGRPVANLRAYVLDKHRKPIPVGIPGELYLGGVGVALGYFERDALTRERFMVDPFVRDPEIGAERMYKTGDRVRFCDDGTLEFLGRVDTQVKLRGFRIELGEIERALAQHPAVQQAVVVLFDDDGKKQLVGYVVSANAVVSVELRSFLRSTLPDYMIPSTIMRLARLPITPNGKVDRKALPRPEQRRDPALDGGGPRNPVEELLLGIWREVLRDSTIGVHDNFFDVGGHSLLTLQVASRAAHAGLRLTPDQLFQRQTIAELAAHVAPLAAIGSEADWSSLVAMRKTGSRPPLYFIHSTPGDVFGYINLVGRLGSDQPCYGLQSLGLHKPEAAHETIETMAAYYLEQIRRLQPEGPYFLAGWCYGGVVAFEMAQQLRDAGELVPFLGLIDAPAPRPDLREYRYYLDRFRRYRSMSPLELATYVKEKAYRGLRERFFLPTDEVLQVKVESGPLANRAEVTNVNLRAIQHYRPRHYAGWANLFCISESQSVLLHDESYGWSTLVRGYERDEVGGAHESILREPRSATLASKIRNAMDRVIGK